MTTHTRIHTHFVSTVYTLSRCALSIYSLLRMIMDCAEVLHVRSYKIMNNKMYCMTIAKRVEMLFWFLKTIRTKCQ